MYVFGEGPADMPEGLMNNPPSPSVPSCPSRSMSLLLHYNALSNRQTNKKKTMPMQGAIRC